MNSRRLHAMSCLIICVPMCAIAQVDPGPRGGVAGAGGYYPTLSGAEQTLFSNALARFTEVDSVSGTVPGEAGSGLGPAFNGNSCAQCHAQPAIGGSSPGLTSRQNPQPNPQVQLAGLDGAANQVPPFITSNGPVREARFISDGGVHGLFTIRGRVDAQGCALQQENFAQQLANNNVVFRIPTPLYGLGLVEGTPDATLQASLAATQAARAALGIGGRFNTSGNDGTVTRFGWKAQNKSLLIFAGEAYNVEQGVANEVFPNERNAIAGCALNPAPEDFTSATDSSDVTNFAVFMRLLAPPAATTRSASELAGQAVFNTIGCAMCHTASLTTGASRYTGMSGVTYHPYSDFALHHMGTHLADGITQGIAGVDDFRTAPLWGLGQRLFFLHDGRASDLMDAILSHASPGNVCAAPPPVRQGAPPPQCGSEANAVIAAFQGLRQGDQQNLLNFLRSL